MEAVLPFGGVAQDRAKSRGGVMTAAVRPNGQGQFNFSAMDRAIAAVAASRSMSNRALAHQIDVDESTVRKARRATADHSAARVGKDGKLRRLPIRQSATVAVAGVAPRRRRAGNILIGSTVALIGVALSAAGATASISYALATTSDADRFLFASVA